MNSLILQTATRMLLPLLLVVSVVILMRGHSEPGGGFVGGLIVAAAFVLYGMAHGPDKLDKLIPVNLQTMIGCGLLLAFFSAMPGFINEGVFMKGTWGSLPVPGLGDEPLHIGTPVFFDIGVYIVVIGVVTLMFKSLAER